MKKFMLSYICLLSVSTTLAYGTTEWANLAEYNTDMEKQGKPKILIVGCGHRGRIFQIEGDHTHEDSWCVNISEPEKYMPSLFVKKPKNPASKENIDEQPKRFFKQTEANEEFDITVKHTSQSRKKWNFDVVVLERNWEKTLYNPRTLYNATSMLKTDSQCGLIFMTRII